MSLINGFHLRNVRGDVLGGITAAVVALPLALAFGNAALGPGGAIYGLYGAVVVGFLAALFGGTPAQVSGPTGPMSVTVAGVVAGLAAVGVPRDLSAGQILPLVMAAVVIGGLFQILFGILKLGRLIDGTPFGISPILSRALSPKIKIDNGVTINNANSGEGTHSLIFLGVRKTTPNVMMATPIAAPLGSKLENTVERDSITPPRVLIPNKGPICSAIMITPTPDINPETTEYGTRVIYLPSFKIPNKI